MMEIIIPENNQEGLPSIKQNENIFYMSNSAIPTMPNTEFALFFERIKEVQLKEKMIIVEINLGYFSSNMKAVFHNLMNLLNKSWYKCRPTIKWHYYEDDEDTLEYGEVFRDLYENITFDFVSIPKPGKK